MQHRRDNSWGVLDWVELADTIFDVSGLVLDMAIDAAAAALEAFGALFSLLDVL